MYRAPAFGEAVRKFSGGGFGGLDVFGKNAGKIALFQAADTVAQLSGLLEFEIFGGVAHLGFEFLEKFGELLFVADICCGGVEFRLVERDSDVVGFDDVGELHVDALDDGHRGDVIFRVVSKLLGAAAIGLVDSFIHGIGAAVGVENGAAFNVAGAAADSLNERGGAAEIAFLVGVENGDEGDFGKVETFPKKVDADEDVEFAATEVAQNLDAIERFDLGMQVAAANADFGEVFTEIFGPAVGERGDENALVFFRAFPNCFEDIVNLAFDGTNFDLRVDEARGANDLFDEGAAGARQFVRTGSGGNVDDLVEAVFEFLEGERAIVERAGHAETVVDESLFAGTIAVVHGADLRDGLVRFVDEEEKIVGDVVEQ